MSCEFEEAEMNQKKSANMIHPVVYILAFSLFAMGSAEFLMGGILPMIAADLHITLPKAGSLISAFAVGALIGAPPFAILTLYLSKRGTLFASQMAFIIATIFSLLAHDYWLILLSRFAMGLAYACFWAVAAAVVIQLSSTDHRAKALSLVVSGLTVAMILGGPAGTLISDLTSWRGGFWAIVMITAISAIASFFALPRKTFNDAPSPDLKTELRAMKRPVLWVAYATTAATTAAYMGTFSYLGALLLDVSGLPINWLPAVLTLFGIGALIGLTIGGQTADGRPFATLLFGITGLIFVSAAIALLASDLTMTIVLVFLLGVFGFLVNPAVWSRVYMIAPDAPMLAGATNSSAFQAGLTFAPLLAGLPISFGYGIWTIGWIGVAIGVVALGLAILDARLSRT